MPLSLLFHLEPLSTVPEAFLGREAQTWFLRQVEALDLALSQELHDGANRKPYTVSDVMRAQQGGFLLRITAFDDRLEDFVLGRLIPALPDRLRLWWADFRILRVLDTSSGNPLAARVGWADLAQAGELEKTRSVLLNFFSPTAFRSQGADIPLPLPALLFRGWLEKWNECAPAERCIDPRFLDFAELAVQVDALQNLNTHRVEFANGKRGGATGFQGAVGISVLPRKSCAAWAEDAHKPWAADWVSRWEAYRREALALALFSFFCGTGHHTAAGLGQTHPVLSGGQGRDGQ